MHTQVRFFAPPFCPNPQCPHHLRPVGWKCKRAGFYLRQCPPHRIQRFQCLLCRRFFSSQTFSTTYWLKLPHLLPRILLGSLACSALRQIAREASVAPATVQRLLERLGRHCLLFQHLHQPPRLAEPLVIDGFESFEFSQYWPFHFNLAVGAHSHFLYAFTDAELRRKGRMTPYQKQHRQHLESLYGRPDPKALQRETARLLQLLLPQGGDLEIRSDEHPAYPRALRTLANLRVRRHRVIPSTQPRTPANPLFPVNLLDLLIRHSGANHKRETIAFSKRRQAAAERLAIFQVWRNFLKSFSEKKQDATPAQRLGLRRTKMTVQELLQRRLFPHRVALPQRLQHYYDRLIPTRQIPNGRTHRLAYAY